MVQIYNQQIKLNFNGTIFQMPECCVKSRHIRCLWADFHDGDGGDGVGETARRPLDILIRHLSAVFVYTEAGNLNQNMIFIKYQVAFVLEPNQTTAHCCHNKSQKIQPKEMLSYNVSVVCRNALPTIILATDYN